MSIEQEPCPNEELQQEELGHNDSLSIGQEPRPIEELHQEALEYEIAREQVLRDLHQYSLDMKKEDPECHYISDDMTFPYKGTDLKPFLKDPGVVAVAFKCFVLRDTLSGDYRDYYSHDGHKEWEFEKNLPEGILSFKDLDEDFFGDADCVIEFIKKVPSVGLEYWLDDVAGLGAYISEELRTSKEFFRKLVKLSEQGYSIDSNLFLTVRPEKIDKEVLEGYKKIIGDHSLYEFLYEMSDEEWEALRDEDEDFYVDVYIELLKETDLDRGCFGASESAKLDYALACRGYDPWEIEEWINADTFKVVAEAGLMTLWGVPLDIIENDLDSANKVVDRCIEKGVVDMKKVLDDELIEKCPSMVNKFLAANPKNFWQLPEDARRDRLIHASIFEFSPDIILLNFPSLHDDFIKLASDRGLLKNLDVETRKQFIQIMLRKNNMSRNPSTKESLKYYIDKDLWNLYHPKERKE